MGLHGRHAVCSRSDRYRLVNEQPGLTLRTDARDCVELPLSLNILSLTAVSPLPAR